MGGGPQAAVGAHACSGPVSAGSCLPGSCGVMCAPPWLPAPAPLTLHHTGRKGKRVPSRPWCAPGESGGGTSQSCGVWGCMGVLRDRCQSRRPRTALLATCCTLVGFMVLITHALG